MAIQTPNMCGTAAEAADVFTPTPASASFSALLVALSALIEAERDIEDVDIWDPAFSRWLRDAELAQERVVAGLRQVREAELQRAEDRPLQRLAMLIDAMMGCEDPDGFARLHRLIPANAALFRCDGDSAAARRVNHMLLTGLARIEDLAGLDTYADRSPCDGPGVAPACICSDVPALG